MNKALLYGIQRAHFGEIEDNVGEEEEQGESSTAYQKMNSCQYYTITMALYIVIVTLAIFVSDLSTIFDFIGAFGFSMSAFILPALFYLKMTARSPSAKYEYNLTGVTDSSIAANRLGCFFLLLLGSVNMILVIIKTIDNDHSDE